MGLEIGFAIGAALLLGALVYGIIQYGRRDPANAQSTEAATRRVYRTTER